MGNETKELENKRQETEEALLLMRSPEWKQFIIFQKRRSVRLQNRVNDAVEKGDLSEARANLILMKDALKQVEAFEQQTLQNRSTFKPKGEVK